MPDQAYIFKLRRVIGQCNPEIAQAWEGMIQGEGALIFNAARPLAGDIRWAGEGIMGGRCYALVTQMTPRRPSMLHENYKLHAWLIEYVTEEEARDQLRKYYEGAGYPPGYIQDAMSSPDWARSWAAHGLNIGVKRIIA